MGIWDAFSEIVDAVTPWSVVEAEAPVEEPKVSKVTGAGRQASGRAMLAASHMLQKLLRWICAH